MQTQTQIQNNNRAFEPNSFLFKHFDLAELNFQLI